MVLLDQPFSNSGQVLRLDAVNSEFLQTVIEPSQVFGAFGTAIVVTILQSRQSFHSAMLGQTVTPQNLALQQLVSTAQQWGLAHLHRRERFHRWQRDALRWRRELPCAAHGAHESGLGQAPALFQG